MHKPVDIEYCLKVAVGLIASPIPPRFKNKPISLANYDVSFINNAVRSINAGDGLSDRQRELSVKLVSKYTRQFKKIGIDVTDIVATPVFSSSIRQVDRTKLLDVDDNTIYVKFPYSKQLISQFKSLGKKLRATKNEWVKESKVYEVDYNEFNLLQIYNWAQGNKFKYTDSVTDLITQFKEIINNRNQYAIQLIVTDDNCYLSNAPDTLQEWWNQNVADLSAKQQIVKAADQNIDVVNKSKTLKLSDLANKILNDRGGKFLTTEYSLIEIVKCARELEFERIAFVIDGRHILGDHKDEIENAIREYGSEKCAMMVKHASTTYGASSRLQTDTEFAILDSTMRYNHPKSNTDWRPDFVISPNTLTKFRNIYGELDDENKPWICYRAVYQEQDTLEI
jgi:hypothetical protein